MSLSDRRYGYGCSRRFFYVLLPFALLLHPGAARAGDDGAVDASPGVHRLFEELPSVDLRALPLLALVAAIALGSLLAARLLARRGDGYRRHLVALGGLVLLASLVPAVAVSRGGMALTVQAGDAVVADPLSLPLELLARGDLVVLTPPGEEEPVIRRLIGLPGDTVELRGSEVYLNDRLLVEHYTERDTTPADTANRERRSLAANEYYVLADDRADSLDSRDFGPISAEAIVGRAVALLRTDPSSGTVASWPRLLLVGGLLLLLLLLVRLRHRLHLHLRPVLLVGSVAAALLIIHPYYLVGRSMDREVADGDTAITETLSPRLGLLTRGDIIAVNSAGRIEAKPELAGIDVLIKRVIGLPGETLVFKKDRIYINGVALDEPYLAPEYQPACKCHTYEKFAITLGPNRYYVLGDNRNFSLDSRSFGSVPLEDIEARVIALLRAAPFE